MVSRVGEPHDAPSAASRAWHVRLVRSAPAARRWLLLGPAARPTRRELLLIAIMLVLYGSVIRVEHSACPVSTPSGPTLQEILVRAQRDAGRPAVEHASAVDISACSLDIHAHVSVVTFLRRRVGVYAWVDMTLVAPSGDPLASAPTTDHERDAIERLLVEYVPCARTSVGAHTGVSGPPVRLRFSHGSVGRRRGGMVMLARATGGDAWFGPWFTLLRAGFWVGWLLIALLVWWLAVREVKAMIADARRERLRAGLCPSCSYNLRDGGLTRCPECGTDASPLDNQLGATTAAPDQ